MSDYEVTTGRGIQLEKAYFTNVDTGDVVPVMFNPEQVVVKKKVGWSWQAASKGKKGGLQFAAGKPRTVSLKLQMDTSGLQNDDNEPNAKDVRLAIDPLYEMTNITDGEKDPPHVTFEWGGTDRLSFECVIDSMNVTFTKFNTDGTPIRADVALELMETKLFANASGGTTSASGSLTTSNSNTTASGAAGRTSQEQQDKWREVVDDNPQAFPGGNPRQAQAGIPTKVA